MDTNHTPMSREEVLKTITTLTKGIKFAMLTVVTDSGHLKSHPMTTQDSEFDGDVWFLGGKDTEQVRNMQARPEVNVSYADHGAHNYISIAGTAQMIEDPAKLDELWTDFYKAYFPGGKTDPNIQLIKIEAHGAEYWGSDGRLKNLFQMARAAITGKPATDLGTNETVKL